MSIQLLVLFVQFWNSLRLITDNQTIFLKTHQINKTTHPNPIGVVAKVSPQSRAGVQSTPHKLPNSYYEWENQVAISCLFIYGDTRNRG